LPNKATKDVKAICNALVDDPVYRAKLQADLRRRKLHPGIESMLWHYAKGKPKDTVQLEGEMGIDVTSIRASLARRIAGLAARLGTGRGGDVAAQQLTRTSFPESDS
jgi:hypothetical protein